MCLTVAGSCVRRADFWLSPKVTYVAQVPEPASVIVTSAPATAGEGDAETPETEPVASARAGQDGSHEARPHPRPQTAPSSAGRSVR